MEHFDPIEIPWSIDCTLPDLKGTNEQPKLTRENWLQVIFWLDPVSRLVAKFALNYNNDEDSAQEVVIVFN
jgi:hypothetical protein